MSSRKQIHLYFKRSWSFINVWQSDKIQASTSLNHVFFLHSSCTFLSIKPSETLTKNSGLKFLRLKYCLGRKVPFFTQTLSLFITQKSDWPLGFKKWFFVVINVAKKSAWKSVTIFFYITNTTQGHKKGVTFVKTVKLLSLGIWIEKLWHGCCGGIYRVAIHKIVKSSVVKFSFRNSLNVRTLHKNQSIHQSLFIFLMLESMVT